MQTVSFYVCPQKKAANIKLTHVTKRPAKMSADMSTDQSRCLKKERGTKERQVVAGVEAVPERTEEEDDGHAAPTFIDNVTQPDHRGHVPMIKHLLQACT